MNIQLILLFSIATIIFILLIYRVVKSDASEYMTNDIDLESRTGGIIDIELNDYENHRLKEVHYSTLSNHKTEIDVIHSVDNAIFLKFENNKWLNIMYNSVFELYQIENSDPTKLNLEYSLDEMTKNRIWQPIVDQTLINIDLKLEKEEMFMLPKDISLKFESQQVHICFSTETKNKNQIEFGKDWLYIIFGVKQYQKSRL